MFSTTTHKFENFQKLIAYESAYALLITSRILKIGGKLNTKINVEVKAFLTSEILMFQTLILMLVAQTLVSVAKIKVWNIKISNVKNALISTLFFVFNFRPIFKILEVVNSK